MVKQRLWDIPSLWTIGMASVVIVFFMVGAGCLYSLNNGSANAYWLKVGDALINGAIVGIFFAVVKAIFDFPKWRQERAKAAQEAAQKAAQEKADKEKAALGQPVSLKASE
jgi:membrane associated rhomboid family serine protease